MFIALYEMKVKAGKELEFEDAWAKATEAIYRVRGSCGSRLHTTEEAHLYIAYAQWPSEEIFDREVTSDLYTSEERSQFIRMKEATESIKILHRMSVLDDRLKK